MGAIPKKALCRSVSGLIGRLPPIFANEGVSGLDEQM